MVLAFISSVVSIRRILKFQVTGGLDLSINPCTSPLLLLLPPNSTLAREVLTGFAAAAADWLGQPVREKDVCSELPVGRALGGSLGDLHSLAGQGELPRKLSLLDAQWLSHEDSVWSMGKDPLLAMGPRDQKHIAETQGGLWSHKQAHCRNFLVTP